jgi:hypothetical protein
MAASLPKGINRVKAQSKFFSVLYHEMSVTLLNIILQEIICPACPGGHGGGSSRASQKTNKVNFISFSFLFWLCSIRQGRAPPFSYNCEVLEEG